MLLMAQVPLIGQGLLVIEASRSHSDTPHSVRLLWTGHQPNLTTHNTPKGQTYMLQAEFEPVILSSEMAQTHALDRAATRKGTTM
jgi:hypothetical protein